MKRTVIVITLLVVLFAIAWSALAQSLSFELPWFTVAGGGGVAQSTDGMYVVGGTIGQPDAGMAASGTGMYTVVGGFWSWASVPQPPAIRHFVYLPAVLNQ